ncbi:glycoside hydrolase family 18 protein [Salinactinospora qingdaonensis]|uniref:chitinase n=1 Tax=Salinactinospora qingdaonensis TaxID=702744 RepID=A0ABP7FZ18_9ACTN
MSTHQRSRGAFGGSRPTNALLGIVVAVTLGAVFFSAFMVIIDGTAPWQESPRRRVAYFADWNTANRDYTINDVDDSGAAADLTHLMWAFGDVSENGRCHIPPPSEASQAWQIYQRRYDAANSVDGRADEYTQPLAGSLNQLRKLKSKHPHLRTSISLGGWNWSTHFSTAARTEESRRAFVSSCVDLWLRGDLPRTDAEPQGGDGVAAGIFDGIDLDWEWPGGGGRADNITSPDDKRNFTLLVEEFRRQLDELENETDRKYELTVSVSHEEQVMRDSYEPQIFDIADFVTVQGYDFTGAWSDVTSPHSQLYAPEDAPSGPPSKSVHQTVRRYLEYGLPAHKLVVGFPGFGRGWAGVDPQGFGRYASAEGGAEGGYGDTTDAYVVLDREQEGHRFLDPVNGSYWIYDGDEWWSYDTPRIVRMKGRYVVENNLGGLMMWNLDMDPQAQLVAAMADSLRPKEEEQQGD